MQETCGPSVEELVPIACSRAYQPTPSDKRPNGFWSLTPCYLFTRSVLLSRWIVMYVRIFVHKTSRIWSQALCHVHFDTNSSTSMHNFGSMVDYSFIDGRFVCLAALTWTLSRLIAGKDAPSGLIANEICFPNWAENILYVCAAPPMSLHLSPRLHHKCHFPQLYWLRVSSHG